MIGAMPDRPAKIKFGEMRESGVRSVLVYCADYHSRGAIARPAEGLFIYVNKTKGTS